MKSNVLAILGCMVLAYMTTGADAHSYLHRVQATANPFEGTWRIEGDTLLTTRANGVVWTSQNYRRDLPVETTVYHWQMGLAQGHPALQLIFPGGHGQIFFKE